jgi:hypothetical protein
VTVSHTGISQTIRAGVTVSQAVRGDMASATLGPVRLAGEGLQSVTLGPVRLAGDGWQSLTLGPVRLEGKFGGQSDWQGRGGSRSQLEERGGSQACT